VQWWVVRERKGTVDRGVVVSISRLVCKRGGCEVDSSKFHRANEPGRYCYLRPFICRGASFPLVVWEISPSVQSTLCNDLSNRFGSICL
jgi:hypothetical protein